MAATNKSIQISERVAKKKEGVEGEGRRGILDFCVEVNLVKFKIHK